MDGPSGRRPRIARKCAGLATASRGLSIRHRQPHRDVDVLRAEDLRQRLPREPRAEPRIGASRRRSAPKRKRPRRRPPPMRPVRPKRRARPRKRSEEACKSRGSPRGGEAGIAERAASRGPSRRRSAKAEQDRLAAEDAALTSGRFLPVTSASSSVSTTRTIRRDRTDQTGQHGLRVRQCTRRRERRCHVAG